MTFARALVIAWCALFGLGMAAPTCAQPQPATAASDARQEAADLLWWGDFHGLERLYQQAATRKDRDAKGFSQLKLVREGMEQIFRGAPDDNLLYYAQLEALTRRWAEANPGSSLAQLLYVNALTVRAWQYRGGGYASSVTPQGWAGFQKYIDMARSHLAAKASVVHTDATATVYAIMLGRAAGSSIAAQRKIAEDGLHAHPDDEGIYEALLTSTLPKWGGNAETIDRLVRDAVERTRPTRGQELYAVLYGQVAADLEGGFFDGTKVDWETLKQGYRELLARYPHPDHVNRFAYIACLAQDRDTASELLAKVGTEPRLDQWGRPSSRAGTFEACKRWTQSGPKPSGI